MSGQPSSGSGGNKAARGAAGHDLAALAMAATAKTAENSAFQSLRDASKDVTGADGRVPGVLAQGIASLLPQAANLARAAEVPAPAPGDASLLAAASGLGEDAATSRDPSLLGVSSDDGTHGAPSAACSARKRGRPLSRGAEDDDKALTVQERNRQAQARFRQRQKDKMSVLDAQVKELKADKIRLQEENKALNNRKSILEKVLALKEEQIQVLQNGAGIFQGVTHGNKGEPVAPGAPTDAAAAASTPQPSGITSEQLIKAWKDCVKALSGLLMKLDSEGENSGYVEQIEQLMSSTASVCRRVSFENPNAAKVLVCTRFHDVDVTANTSGHWAEVVKQLSLSTAQKEEIVNLSRTYRSEMAALKHQRHEHMASLACSQPDLYSCAGQCRNSLESGKICINLQEMLRQEHQVHSEYAIAVLDKVFSRLQLAQASVTSYPFFPDALQMSAILEAEVQSAGAGPARARSGANDLLSGA